MRRQASLSQHREQQRGPSSATAITLNKLARNLGVPVAAILRDKDDEPGVDSFPVPAGAAA